MNSLDNIKWLQAWMIEQYSGDHEGVGVKIEYVHFPQYGAWSVIVDTNDTDYNLPDVKETGEYLYDADFYSYEVKAGIFSANCDLTKMNFIIGKFRKIINIATIPASSAETFASDDVENYVKYS